MSETIQIAKVVSPTEAEGPGRRFALWVQGCPLRCAGCCNPAMLSSRGGERREVSSLLEEIASHRDDIEGVTFLGGEPFSQAAALAELARGARGLGLSVMAFSGHTLSELRERDDAATTALIDACDLLVDGPYDASQPDQTRRWIGSRNQVMHFLTARYERTDAQFRGAESFEIRYKNGAVTVNGWPSSSDEVIALLARKDVERA